MWRASGGAGGRPGEGAARRHLDRDGGGDARRTRRDGVHPAVHRRCGGRPGGRGGALVGELLDDTSTEMVVVTRGGRGATAFTQQFTVDVAAPEVTVVD